MLLHINFHKLELTQGSSYIELLKCIALRKAETDKKNHFCMNFLMVFGQHQQETNMSIAAAISLLKSRCVFKKK